MLFTKDIVLINVWNNLNQFTSLYEYNINTKKIRAIKVYSNEISSMIKINNETIAINTQEDTLAILKAKYDDDNKTYYIETNE